ncbi:MAG: hypothetical protein ACYDAD_15630 [Acidimicrobiales bacterium]
MVAGGVAGSLCERVRLALLGDERVGARDLKVSLLGRRLFVAGETAGPDSHAALVATVEELLPGFELHDETTG